MSTTYSTAIVSDLERACCYHFLSLLFQPPTAELGDDLRVLVPRLPDDAKLDADALLDALDGGVEADYHRLLGGSGACPDCESDYSSNPLAGKGPVVADVAAFYQAFHFAGPGIMKLQPDHIAMELDFLGYLALKSAHARHGDLGEELEVCQAAESAFIADHLSQWAPHFCDRLARVAGAGFHGVAAELCHRLLPPVPPSPARA